MMSTWTAQMGFPLVSVVQRHLDGNRRELLLKQSRFLADGGPDETKSTWHIPIGITSASSPNEVTYKVLLRESEATFTLDGIKSDEWVKVVLSLLNFHLFLLFIFSSFLQQNLNSKLA